MGEKIEVWYREVEDPLGNPTGYYHKYVIYTDNNGNQWVARGGPENGDGYDDRGGTDESLPGTLGRLVAEVKPYVDSEYTPDWIRPEDNTRAHELIIEASDLSSYWEVIVERMLSTHDARYQYMPVEQNSNTIVDDALEYAGLPSPVLDNELSSPGSDGGFWVFYPDPWPRMLPDWVESTLDKFLEAESTPSPLVLDLDGDGIELAALNGPGSVFWDGDVDGMSEATGWIAGGDGLLAIDLNSDGIINDHSELFGDQTGYANGFLALAAYDSNASGTITSAVAQFGNLRVWVDANADGYSQSGELFTLSSLGITSINLGYSNVNYAIAGNAIKQQSTFTMNGNTRTIVDAWFSADQANSVDMRDYTVDERVLFMPTLRGYGDLPDLHIAMSRDEDLLELVLDFVTGLSFSEMLAAAQDPFSGPIQEIMFHWAGVENVDPESRDEYVDARIVEFMEALTANDFSQGGTVIDPQIYSAHPFHQAWVMAYDAIATRLIYQAAGLNEIFEDGGSYNPFTDTFEEASTLNLDKIEDLMSTETGWASKFNLARLLTSIIDQSIGIDNLTNGDHTDLQALMPAGVTMEALANVATRNFTLTSTPLEGTADDDLLIGDYNIGLPAGDEMYGYDGNDILIGRDVQDIQYGGSGNDTYVFNIGDGGIATSNEDEIFENLSEGTDRIVFGSGIDADDITLWTLANGDLSIQYGATDVIIVDAGVVGGATPKASTLGSYLEQIVFDDGTVWDFTGGLHLRSGDAAGRTMYGSNGNDIFEVGAGTDALYGYNGNDTYMFNMGDGGSTPNNPDNIYEAASAGFDRIVFGAGITPDNIYLWNDGTGDLIIKYGGTNDYLSIDAGVVGGATPKASTVGSLLEQIVFADSTTWDLTNGLHLRNTDTSRTMYGTNYDDVIEDGSNGVGVYGYDGNDVLYGGGGADTLYGGAGADTFAWRAGDLMGAPLDTVSDFSKTAGDKIDLSDLLDSVSYDPLSDLLSNFVRFTEGSNKTTLYVDVTGTGTFSAANDVATLTGVTDILAGGNGAVSTNTDLQNLITNGILIAA